jgi:hypothetical protein
MTTKDEKAARMAAALRANLRKRKAQARGDVTEPPRDPEIEPER